MSQTTFIGLKELQEFLNALPEKLRRNVMRTAMKRGANVLREDAKSRVPVAAANKRNAKLYGGYMGALRASIRSGTRIKRDGTVVGYVRAGGKRNGADTYYAKWVEYGTRPHEIGEPGQVLFINGNRVFAPVMHPGAKPKPYMRPALDAKHGEAVVAVGNHVKHRLSTKYGLDVADIDVAEN